MDGLLAGTWYPSLERQSPILWQACFNLRAERNTMEWHCTAYRDSIKVALFVSQSANVVASMPFIVVPSTLYRGTSLHNKRQDQSQVRRLGFFTASKNEAFSYAKYSPRAVYIREFTGLRVFDMTSYLVVSTLVGIAE